MFGGQAVGGDTANTEDWNGTSWTEVADLAQNVKEQGGHGTSVEALSVGGWIGSVGSVVYEWTVPQNIKTITD